LYKVKILGAGSIGNHLAHASRRLGWQVALCDVDAAALERARRDIYPGRYGAWDEAIELYLAADAPKSVYDLIVIGTPPDVHVDLAIEAIGEKPRAVLVEKPLCGPDLRGAEELRRLAAEQGVTVFVGYDHVVGKAAVAALAAARQLDEVETLDVEFREHWAGIFAAHSWLDGPQDSYLGFWERGGGASGEHSHAINLWEYFARGLGAGEVSEVSATMAYVREGGLDYDKLCLLNLRTESGLVGRVVQDVVTMPPRKWARIQGRDGYVNLGVGAQPGADGVEWKLGDAEPENLLIEKTRPDDFIQELEHIEAVLDRGETAEVLRLDRGLDTMLVVAAAHRSAREGRTIRIDRAAGCTPDALAAA
jgi:predicted dehydrogenase